MTDKEQSVAVLDGLGGGFTIGNVHLTDQQVDVLKREIRSQPSTPGGIEITFTGRKWFKKHCGVRMLTVDATSHYAREHFKPAVTFRRAYVACSACGFCLQDK